MILADHTLAAGRVLEPQASETGEAIARFNDHLRSHPRVECVLLTTRDGIILVRRRR